MKTWQNRIITRTVSSLILLVASQANADYKTDILGQLTLSQTGKADKTYQTGDTFNAKTRDKICLKAGKGYLTIEAENTEFNLSHKSKPCIVLSPSEKTNYYFATKDELSVPGVRGRIETYTMDIHPNSNGSLHVTSSKWKTAPSRLPYTIEVISPTGKRVERFKNNNKVISFVFPKSFLSDKEGYTFKVTNQFNEVLVDSVFYHERIEWPY